MFKSTGSWLIAIGTILLGGSQYFSFGQKHLQSELKLKSYANEIVRDIENVGLHIADFDKSASINQFWNSKQREIFKVNKIEVYQFTENKPVLWTNNQFYIVPDTVNTFEIVHQGSIHLAKWNRIHGRETWVYVYNIFENQGPKLNPDSLNEKQNSILDIDKNPFEQGSIIHFKGSFIQKNESDYYIGFKQYSASLFYDLIFLFGLSLISLGIYIVSNVAKLKLFKIVNWLIWFLATILFTYDYIAKTFKQLKLFSSELFYFNSFFQSIGLTLIWVLLFFWLLSIVINYIVPLLPQLSLKKKITILTFMYGIALAILLFIFILAKDLVGSTDIHFDFFEILLVTRYTLISVGILVLLMVCVFTILNEFAPTFYELDLNHRLMIFLLSFIPNLIYCYSNFQSLLYCIIWIFFIIIWFVFRKNSKARFDYTRILLQVLLPCFSLSIILNTELRIKENTQRKFLSSQLLLKADKVIKEHLYDAEIQLNSDKGVVDYYSCKDETKEAFESRLEQLYFNGKYENYDISIFDFDGQGQSYRIDNTIDYSTLNAIYFSDLCIQVTNRFFLINERRLRGCYLGKFNVVAGSQLLGSYFVLLTPKFGNTQGRLSDVIEKNTTESLFRRYQYSYAIYNRNKLNRHSGQFDYPAINLYGDSTKFFNKDGFSHYVQRDEYNNIVIITKKDESVLISSIQFTLLSLVGFILILLYLLVLWIQQRASLLIQRFKFSSKFGFTRHVIKPQFSTESWFLSRRLQLYITWLVFGIFLIVIFVTINYFIQNNIDRQQQYLMNKANNVANKISGEINLDALHNKYEVGLVYDLADYYETDINVYDQFGKLIVSTNPKLYSEKYTGELMNPTVFRKFQTNEISSAIVSENIADLSYISAYTTLIDNDLNVRGYVNLPYFSNREDLFREISQYTVTIINLFVLIFALAIILTYYVAQRLSKPLILIKNQLSQMKIGEKNLPIQWQRNDEIGLLVAEYNKMLSALDSSLDRLAESERQGAWREMAKQVAHEIKNPLTPMRLSLQHLQYSMGRGDDNIEEKVKKTIALMIRQIDSLSAMAEEFSSFAKMPEPILENIDLKLVLTDAVDLMEKEMGQPITLKIEADTIPVLADPHQLGRIFNNIFKNAIQAIPEDRVGQIVVDVTMLKKSVLLTISDNGKGIPPELFDKIFSPNFSTKNSGMGLGLAITKKIIEQFNGRIQFKSEINVGTVFEIEIPLNLG